MHPLRHFVILIVMLYPHPKNLLGKFFSANVSEKNLINISQKLQTTTKILKNSNFSYIISNNNLNEIVSVPELFYYTNKNNLSRRKSKILSLSKDSRPKRIVKRENSATNESEDLRNENISKLNKTVAENNLMNSNDSSADVPLSPRGSYLKYITFFARILYAIVCIVGLCGNTLVIYVVLRFSKMQTVTNMYILNLALADEMFLFGLPFLIITITYNYWAFGWLMCKIYMIMTSINQFTSSLLLTVMSADRYIAVCHPISSPRYRTPCIAKIICLSVWTLSVYLMIPIFIFADVQDTGEKLSCNIYWPEIYDNFKGQRAFTIYSFTLGFFVPLILILLFYFLVICKLRTISTKHKSREKKKTQRKVTYLVLVVISCYILCWLPYWITQVYITFEPPMTPHNEFSFTFMLLAGCLSYANSACNPILYAFLSENFKKSFAKAFTCTSNVEVNAQLHGENSVFPQHHLSKGKQSSSSRIETASTYLDSNHNKVQKKSKSSSNSDKAKSKDYKKQSQITTLTTKISNLRKNKRLSLDLTSYQANRHCDDVESNVNKSSNYDIDNPQKTKPENKSKPVKSNQNNAKEIPLSFELNRHRLEEPMQINKDNNQKSMSSKSFKRRRKSEPELSMTSTSTDAAKDRRSTLISQDDVESVKVNEGTASDLDEDDLVYESDEEDYEDDSSLNSSQTNERNCAAMPARLKAKFLGVGSGSKFRSLSRKSTSLKRQNSSNGLEAIRQPLTKNARKISLVSSESSQIKKSNRNKLFSLMNKLTNKQPERIQQKEKAEIEKSTTPDKRTDCRIPTNRISRKRISHAEAIHHRLGNLKHIQMDKINSQSSFQTTKIDCECRNQCKHESTNSRENYCSSNPDIMLQDQDSKQIKPDSIFEYVNSNDRNNNYDANSIDHFILDETNHLTNCRNSKSCESIECAQCSKCLEKRGVIQTQL